MLSRNDGSSDGILARTLFGGSIGRYAKCSFDRAIIERRSSSKLSRLELKFIRSRTLKETEKNFYFTLGIISSSHHDTL